MTRTTKWIGGAVITGIIAVVIVLWRGGKNGETGDLTETIEEVVDSTEAEQVHYKYGIPVDDFEVDEGVVAKNEHLSAILSRYGVSAAKIQEVVARGKGVFDTRKIRAGNKYTLFLARDSLKSPEFFIYEQSATEFVVMDFKESGEAYIGQKEVENREMTARVTITSSLWNAMKEAGADPALAVTLADIYAWAIDFYGIAKGDSVRVIYEQPFVEGMPIGRFDVKGAIFTHAGKAYHAIPYPRAGRVAYFDEKGNSLQKAFLKAPLRYSRVSSRFSNNRYHPVLKINRPHHGVDYAAPTGTPVYTIGDGVVTKKAFQQNGGGNYVTVKHNGVYSTTYMHLSKFATGIKVGSRLTQGDVIGYVGSTGLATGPHLDFRVYKNGSPINPLAMESPSKEPVAREEMERYLHLKDSIVDRLARL
ncbi:MAG: peptidoglycan DD-metalloendopeptidase family protein [Odoribacteraceae bacterium]|jgi:murein DD-endopeptidase MepM/ murein hydrolase activator NlpD|nr:peptidoglycan DD-metalloendopeptidase family protein [Odoribacteraceae bacterium]